MEFFQKIVGEKYQITSLQHCAEVSLYSQSSASVGRVFVFFFHEFNFQFSKERHFHKIFIEKSDSTITTWKNSKFTLADKIFRQITFSVISLVKMLLSRNFCQKK